MRILETPLGQDVLKVLSAYHCGSGTHTIDVEVQTAAGLVLQIERLHEVILNRDFGAVGDDIVLVMEAKRSVYEHHIFPNRADLKVTLTITPTTPVGDNPGQPEVGVYRAYLDTPVDDTIKYSTFTGDKLGDKDGDFRQFAMRLTEEDLDKFLAVNFSAIPAETDVKTLIRTITSNLGQFPIYIHEPDNKDINPHILVPMSVAAIDLPRWLQELSVGVYNYGCGVYFLNGWVYVYPRAKLENDPTRPRHVIVRLAPNEMIGMENTYAQDEGTTYIICNGDVLYQDTTEMAEKEVGNNIRWSGVDMWGGVVKHSNGEHEFANHTLKFASKVTRRTNLTKVHNRTTSNDYHERSRLTALNGKMVTLPWENCNPALIKPDTEVEIHYISSGERLTLTGIIVAYSQVSKRKEGKGTRDVFTRNGTITCLLN